MFRPRVIPVLLLKGKGLVKTEKYKKANYIGDPINAVKIFNELETDELVFLDINATKENRTISIDLVREIGDEAYMPFAVGGGIRDLDTAIKLVNTGAEKLVFNSAFYDSPELITKVAETIGNQSVVISIDVRKNAWGKLAFYTRSGTYNTKMDPLDVAKKAEELGAGEIILNDIVKESTMLGYNTELIKKISESVNIPVVASCGAGTLDHMKIAVDNGAHAVAAGSMFVYHGPRRAVLINYPTKEELIELFNKG